MGTRQQNYNKICLFHIFLQGNLPCPPKEKEIKSFFLTYIYIKKKSQKQTTRGQRPNESQKAVIIYMMKSVGEIASKMWPVV